MAEISKETISMKGVIDMHVHSNPDLRRRAYDDLELIKEAGYEHVMVDTDGGQTENPYWELAFGEYMQYLVDNGIPAEHVYHMTKTIPARLLGLEEGGRGK